MEDRYKVIRELLPKLLKDISNTDHSFKAQLYSDKHVYPIPFFGDIEGAKVITVGINPALSEFRPSRNWPQEIDTEYLCHRLRNYFNFPGAPPHNWFDVWDKALNILGISYHSGEAAHIDLSARPTINIEDISEIGIFEDMVVGDMHAFLQLIGCCNNLKLIMIAGAVSKRYYINEFIDKYCCQYEFRLDGKFSRIENPGRGKTAFHRLIGINHEFPVFFCSISPSARNSSLLVERVGANRLELIKLIE